MSFYFPIFLGIVVALFFFVPVKLRTAILLATSYLFCGWIELRAAIVLLMFSIVTWLTGWILERLQKKGQKAGARILLIIVVSVYLFVLCFYKTENRIIPVGLSFYLFQAVGYLTDIFRNKETSEKNFLNLSLYLAFFPKLVSGPIEREKDFLPQLENLKKVKFVDRGRWSVAFTYMLWGYFMKMVVADRLAEVTTIIFEAPAEFDSFWLILGILFYTIQIYCDFAGYSYIAVGCARIFGIQLTQNFAAPYRAESITDFWRRWHISLSLWLREYIYIPLGGNRKGMFRKGLNTMIVFLVCGIWHGNGAKYVVWGLLHGGYSVAAILARHKGWKIKGRRALTFVSVAFAWIFFKASSLRAAVQYIWVMVTSGIHINDWQRITEALQLNAVEGIVTVAGILTVWAVDILCDRKKKHLPDLIQDKQSAVRYFIFYVLLITIFVFGMYGPGYQAEQFIYMQF